MAGENEANFRICSSVSEALSYMPCPLQYTQPSNHNQLFVFWSQHNDEFPTVFPTNGDTTIYPGTVKEKITHALKNAYISDYYACWLVQFWAPITTNDQIFLTTCDLPFGLTKLHEGLCLYRSECLKYRIPIGTDENQLGPTGRVFKHGLPEMSPDVSRYSATDYPQLRLALTAGVGNYLALPVFEPLSNQCTGVLEIIGDKKGSFSQELVQMVYEMLKKVDLRSSNMYDHPDRKGFKGLERALKELEEQLNFICRTHQFPLAQTWLPILDGGNIERFMTTKEQFCICTSAGYEFRAACDMFHLGKSQGVVGRAFLSRSSCFCSDITKLRMSEYPLAHVAHKVGFHGSFAICLQSSYTGDYVYLLEFFLPQDNKSDCRSPQTMLNMLLATMKQQFRSFKLASGRELGEKLLVEVIPIPSDDGLNCFEICQNAKHSSDSEAVASRKKIPWLDTSNRLLNGTVNSCPESIDVTTSTTAANTTTEVRNVSNQANRVVFNSSEAESMMKISEGQYGIKSMVLQQSGGAEVNGTKTTLASQSGPSCLGTEHLQFNDMNCDELEITKSACRHFEKTIAGGDQSYHDTTTSLNHATRPITQAMGVLEESSIARKCSNFPLPGFPADELAKFAKVFKLFEPQNLQDVITEPFVPLVEEELTEVSRALSNSNRRKVLVTHESSNIHITGELLQCLRPGAWLNDEVINVYLELLKEREKKEPRKFLKCHFFDTFFYKKLFNDRGGYNYQSVKRWTSLRKLGYSLFECDKIFVPIRKETHWCLAVINKKDEKFQYLDSLGGRESQVLKVLARYFSDEVKDKNGKDIDVSSWKQEFVEDLPEQENGYDCGMFMLKYADFYSRDLRLSFSQDHMPYFRSRTAKDILRLRAE